MKSTLKGWISKARNWKVPGAAGFVSLPLFLMNFFEAFQSNSAAAFLAVSLSQAAPCPSGSVYLNYPHQRALECRDNTCSLYRFRADIQAKHIINSLWRHFHLAAVAEKYINEAYSLLCRERWGRNKAGTVCLWPPFLPWSRFSLTLEFWS